MHGFSFHPFRNITEQQQQQKQQEQQMNKMMGVEHGEFITYGFSKFWKWILKKDKKENVQRNGNSFNRKSK